MPESILPVAKPSQRPDRSEGFAKVAEWIAEDRDNETLVYRSFKELGARNLLYLQSELLFLEKRLREFDREDVATDDMSSKDAARTWESLVEQSANGNKGAVQRLQIIKDIRVKLREYHETLLLESEMIKLSRPSDRVLKVYRTWLLKPYPVLGGQAKTFLDDATDLIALNSSAAVDYLSLLLRQYWPAKEELSRDGLHRIGHYNEKSINIAVATIDILAAAILLIGPICGLYLVTNDTARLGMIASFTATFALFVGFVTNARRAEVFAATAAYTAVLVVFVSGDISNAAKAQQNT